MLPQRNEAEGIASGPDQLREAVRYQVKYGADVIKFCASGGVLSLADEVDTPQLTLAEMTALCDEAHRLRKKVACHCHGDHAARDAVLGRRRLDRAWVVSLGRHAAIDEGARDVSDSDLDGPRFDHAEPVEVSARDRRQGRLRPTRRFRRRLPKR